MVGLVDSLEAVDMYREARRAAALAATEVESRKFWQASAWTSPHDTNNGGLYVNPKG